MDRDGSGDGWAGDGRDRERRPDWTFVELVDTLVDEFDVTDFLSPPTARCAAGAVVEGAVAYDDPLPGLADRYISHRS